VLERLPPLTPESAVFQWQPAVLEGLRRDLAAGSGSREVVEAVLGTQTETFWYKDIRRKALATLERAGTLSRHGRERC
jgi:hypothetical protein